MNVEEKRKRLNELLLKGIGNLRKPELKEAIKINIELAEFMEMFLEEKNGE